MSDAQVGNSEKKIMHIKRAKEKGMKSFRVGMNQIDSNSDLWAS